MTTIFYAIATSDSYLGPWTLEMPVPIDFFSSNAPTGLITYNPRTGLLLLGADFKDIGTGFTPPGFANGLYYSSDAINWSPTPTFLNGLTQFATSGTLDVLVGVNVGSGGTPVNGGPIDTSMGATTDDLNISYINFPFSTTNDPPNINSICMACWDPKAGQFFGPGFWTERNFADPVVGATFLYTSTDGINWTLVSPPDPLFGPIWGAGSDPGVQGTGTRISVEGPTYADSSILICIGTAGGAHVPHGVAYSVNSGASFTWVDGYNGTDSIQVVSDIKSNGSIYVLTDSLGPGTIWSSPDGKNWTERLNNTVLDNLPSSVAWSSDQGIWMMVGRQAGTNYATSPDGINWTVQSFTTAGFPIDNVNYNFSAVTWAPNIQKWVIAGGFWVTESSGWSVGHIRIA